MFYCYVLKSQKTGRRYVGSCEELDERLRRHNAQESKATKQGVPWTLVDYEIFSARSEALNRERYYKTRLTPTTSNFKSGRQGTVCFVSIF